MKDQNVEKTTKVEETTGVATQTTEKIEGTEERTFTQEEAQKMADAMLAKKLKDMPTKEQVKEYQTWKESQKTEVEKQADKEKEYLAKDNTIKELNQELITLKSGVSVDDVDYVLFKVSKMEGDYKDNLETFLKDNPKYLSKQTTPMATGITAKGENAEKDDGVTAILKAKHPELYQ